MRRTTMWLALATMGTLYVQPAAAQDGGTIRGNLPGEWRYWAADAWSTVTHVDRAVGRVTSLAWVPEGRVAGAGCWIGLAVIRREVGPGTMVRAAGRDARVVELPFAFPFVQPA